MRELTRRDALKATAGLGVVALVTGGCGAQRESDVPTSNRETVRSATTTATQPPRRELVAVEAVRDGEAIDVSTAAGEPAYLVRQGDSVRVLSGTCTHARCTVAWQATSSQFHCPCHRGVYDQQGMVVSGPPPRPLDELPIVVEDGTVYL